jgi:hypothetical protein
MPKTHTVTLLKRKKEKGEIVMKSKSSKVIAMLVTTMLLASVAPAFAGNPSVPHNANSFWLEPTSMSLTTANPIHKIGFLFNVTLFMNTTWPTASYQVKVYCNTAMLAFVAAGWTGPGGSKSQFYETHSTSSSIALASGSITVGETLFGEDYEPGPHHGSLVWITLNVTDEPGKNEVLSSDIDVSEDPGDTWMVYFDGTTETYYYPPTDVICYDTPYTFTWEQPTVFPHMAVEHDGFYGVPPPSPGPPDTWPLYYGPYPPSVNGSAFNVKIYIEDLLGAWGLTSATFCLCYNTTVIDVMGGLADITLNTAVWNPATSTIAITHGDPDEIDFTVFPQPLVVPSGKVLVATVNYTIQNIQKSSPPYPIGYYDFSELAFCDVILEDHVMHIPTGTHKKGEVRILSIVALPMPSLEVSPKDTVLKTEPCHTVLIGEEFDVNVIAKNLHDKWYVVAYQFRLSFDPTLLALVGTTEGPFLTDTRWNLYGTFFISGEEPAGGGYPHHVWAGGILLPNDTGEYGQTIYPSAPGPNVTDLDPPVNPVLATFRFKALQQDCFGGVNLTCQLDLYPFWLPSDCHFVDVDGNYIPTDTPKIVNGTYTIMPMYQYGRIIDLYGGAVNRGYGAIPFPAPYGGQGVGGNMDLVIPQSVVYLFAYVTYNCWPVQSKDVGYEIEGPFYQEGWTPEKPIPRVAYSVRKYSARTNGTGFASIDFQMPWPCENPEGMFGKYRVTATVDICGVVVPDVLWFDYYYLVEITKVTTDKDCYAHCEDVVVVINFRSKAQQPYPVLLAIAIQDELKTAFAFATIDTSVEGAQFCHWKEYEATATLHVMKWAFAGIGHIYVSAFDCDPSDISPITGQHGAPWCPTYGLGWPLDPQTGEPVPLPEICIFPFAAPLTVSISPETITLNATKHENTTFTATASGGLPFEVLPGPSLQYGYNWFLNETYQYGVMGETSTFFFNATGKTPGVYELRVAVEDSIGVWAIFIAEITVVA